jgi:hypothetical protein
MNFEDNPRRYAVFPDVVGQPVVIGEGDYNSVLALSQRHVAKVPLEPSYDLEGEYKMHCELYQAGVSVPKPLGIFRFFPFNYWGEFGIGLVMQRLQGVNGTKTRGKTRVKVERQLEKELEICEELGFKPFDEGLHNCIWNPKEQELHLIDFVGWNAA